MAKIIDKIKSIIVKNFDLLTIIVIATTIRSFAIFKNYQFWMDEMFSFTYSQKPWLDSVKFWTWETNPPLHMFILKLWFYIFPANELFARLPSLIFGVISIFIIYQLSEKLFNKKIAILSALILTLSPIHNLYSITARTYSLLILLSLLSVKYFLEIFYFNQKTRNNIFLFSLINLLFLYSHLTSLVILFCQFATLLAYKKTEIKNLVLYNLIPAVLWCVWAIPSLYFKLNLRILKNTWFFNLQNNFLDTTKALQFFSIGLGSNVYYGLIFLVIFSLLLLVIIINQVKQNKMDEKLLLICFFLFIPIIASLIGGLTNPKFYIIALPWMAIILGYNINNYSTQKLIQFLSLIIFIPGLINFFNGLPINNWGPACEFITKNKNNTKQVLVYDNFTEKNEIDYYCHLKITTIPYLPPPHDKRFRLG